MLHWDVTVWKGTVDLLGLRNARRCCHLRSATPFHHEQIASCSVQLSLSTVKEVLIQGQVPHGLQFLQVIVYLTRSSSAGTDL